MKNDENSSSALKFIFPLCFILIFFLQSFARENLSLTEEIENLEEAWKFEESPREYILSNVETDDRNSQIVRDNLDAGKKQIRASCPYFIRSSNLTQRFRAPDVIGIGLAKCGTGSLSFLDCHPQIIYTAGESRYFENELVVKDILAKKKNLKEKLLSEYFTKLRPAAENEILIETSPQYALTSKKLAGTKSKEENIKMRRREAEAMKAVNPKIKVIVIFCDPIKRAFSLFSMNVRNNHAQMTTEVGNFDSAVKRGASEVRTYGEFVDVIAPFEDVLGKENVLILDGELAIRNPNEEFGRILDFIGVEKRGFEFEIDEQKGFPCLVKPAKSCLKATKGTSRKVNFEDDYPEKTKTWREYLKPFMISLTQFLNLCKSDEINKDCCAEMSKEGSLFSFVQKYIC